MSDLRGATGPTDVNVHHTMHIDLLIGWSLYGVVATYDGAASIAKVRIDAKPVGLMARDRVRDFIGRITIHTRSLGPRVLRLWIIRQLGLRSEEHTSELQSLRH